MIVHTDCDMPQALINRVENSFADVYFTPHWQHSLDSQYQKPLAQIVNQFMSEIQVPAVEKHRAALEAAFGIKSIANKNLPFPKMGEGALQQSLEGGGRHRLIDRPPINLALGR